MALILRSKIPMALIIQSSRTYIPINNNKLIKLDNSKDTFSHKLNNDSNRKYLYTSENINQIIQKMKDNNELVNTENIAVNIVITIETNKKWAK
jgi:hypothetical protein